MPEDAPRPSYYPAGYDAEDPYESTDISTLPDWWQTNIEEFRAHGLRPYRPPRFEDGEVVPVVIREIERELDTGITIRVINPQAGNDWEIYVADELVATVPRTRTEAGFSQYHITSSEFRSAVYAHIDHPD